MPEEALITVLLADDDPVQLAYLAELVSQLRPSWVIVAQVMTSTDLKHELVQKNPSLAILDVTFSDMTSLEVVRSLQASYPVIFVTGDLLFAAEAFTYEAIDFVLKPLRTERMEQALRRADLFLQQHTARVKPVRREVTSLRIFKGNDLIWTALDEVRYFEAQRKFTRVVLAGHEGLLKMGISAVVQHLDPARFWQIHRGVILNVTRMSAAKRDELGRLVITVANRSESLIVSKPYEYLFRDGFS